MRDAILFVLMLSAPTLLYAGAPLLSLPDAPMACGEATGQTAGNGSYLVQASHNLPEPSGTVRRFGLALSADGKLTTAPVPEWDAARLLTGIAGGAAPQPSPEARNIYTLVYDNERSSATVPFHWDSLPETVRTLLDSGDGLGQARADFLRGDRSREAGHPSGIFRQRSSVLGDVVRGAPTLVGGPSAAVQGTAYAQFHARVRNRRSAVYVGANDGMLHAFDVITGAELFAYVPNALLPFVQQLTTPDYIHRPYVDAIAGYGEAPINGEWRTVLASGMGTGARGVFALDISDPSNFASGLGAIWEFTERDDAAIGYVRSPPLIAKFRVGMNGTTPAYRFFAVVSSGLNNYGPDGEAHGALFLLALDKAASEPWRHGVNYYKLNARASDPALANALGPSAFAIGGDGSVRYAYAGDLQGNLWRFDFTGTSPSNALGQGSNGQLLFVARDSNGLRQPIAHAPAIVFAPGRGYIVIVGTGRFIEPADLDPARFTVQSLYAIRDSAQRPTVLVNGRDELAPRLLSGQGPYLISGATLRYEGQGAKKGWYFDFPNASTQGERATGTALLASGVLLMDTLAPGTATCTESVVRSYVVDALSGMAHRQPGEAADTTATGTVVQGARTLAPPRLVEMGGTVGTRNPTGAAMSTRTVTVVHAAGAGLPAVVSPVTVNTPVRRVSWREVANWQELHEAATR